MMLPWALSHKALASLARVAVSVLEANANESASLSSVCDVLCACVSCTKRAPIPKLVKDARLPVPELKREQENVYRAVIWKVP